MTGLCVIRFSCLLLSVSLLLCVCVSLMQCRCASSPVPCLFLQFGFRKWKSHVTQRPMEDRSVEVRELYSELNVVKPQDDRGTAGFCLSAGQSVSLLSDPRVKPCVVASRAQPLEQLARGPEGGRGCRYLFKRKLKKHFLKMFSLALN